MALLAVQGEKVPDDEKLFALIGKIYDASITPDEWPAAIRSIAHVLRAQTAVFLRLDHSLGEACSLAPLELTTELIPEYQEYLEVDPWDAYLRQQPAGTMVLTQNIVPDKAFLKYEYYYGFLRPQDLFYGLGGFVVKEDERAVLLGFHRARRVGAFDGDEHRLLSLLVPHLGRAIEINRRNDDLNLNLSAAGDALQRLAYGVFLIDSGGRVLHANAAAEDILRKGDGLVRSRGRLAALHPDDNRLLQRVLGGAVCPAHPHSAGVGGSLAVRRPGGRRAYQVLVAPVGGRDPLIALYRPAALLYVNDPERTAVPPREVLRRWYDLTHREAALAAELATGAALGDVAERLNISMTTARNYLQRIYRKTDTRRQGELIALLRAFVPVDASMR